MQNVLVHIDCGIGPIGAWSYLNGKVSHFYPNSLDQRIPARARLAMAARGTDTTVPQWFIQLAARTPYTDDYETVDVSDGVSLPAIVAEFRRAWKQQP